MWKAVHNGVPTFDELHRRVEAISQECPRCGNKTETLTHLIFQCSASRATWLASPMTLRMDRITIDFKETLLHVTEGRDAQQITTICNMIWCIWKGRNEIIFTDKRPTPRDILRQVSRLDPPQRGEQGSGTEREDDRLVLPVRTTIMMIDGSWDETKRAGWGALLYDEKGKLCWGAYEHTMAVDLLHAEAMALKEVLQRCEREEQLGRWQRMQILTDNKVLAKAVNSGENKSTIMGSNGDR